jgi:hypothetical protein
LVAGEENLPVVSLATFGTRPADRSPMGVSIHHIDLAVSDVFDPDGVRIEVAYGPPELHPLRQGHHDG